MQVISFEVLKLSEQLDHLNIDEVPLNAKLNDSGYVVTSDTLGTYNRAVWNTPEPNKEKTRTLVYDPNLSAMNPTNGGAKKKRIHKKILGDWKKAAYSRLMLGHLWVALHFNLGLFNPRQFDHELYLQRRTSQPQIFLQPRLKSLEL